MVLPFTGCLAGPISKKRFRSFWAWLFCFIYSNFTTRKNWLDPVIGARLIYNLNNKWLFSLHGDIGGFDLISKFTWELKLVGMYKFNRYLGVAAGFRAVDVDYKDGKGANEFRFNNVFYGPEVGIAVTF